MNNENLKRGNPATQFKPGQDAVEKGRKGAAVAKANRQKRQEIRKVIQTILDSEYEVKNKETGQLEKRTGVETLAYTLFKIAVDPKHKLCIQAHKLIYELADMDKTPEEKKRIKQALKIQQKEIELMQKKIDSSEEW